MTLVGWSITRIYRGETAGQIALRLGVGLVSANVRLSQTVGISQSTVTGKSLRIWELYTETTYRRNWPFGECWDTKLVAIF